MKRILIIWALLTSVCFAQSKAGFYVVGGKIITVQDTSSRKYLKAVEDAGVVPSVVQNFASNYLVTTEKAISVWTLIKAQYPFIGGTAGTHKFNINNPLDTDGAFRATFTGGVTHNSSGVVLNGSSGYIDTKIIMSTDIGDTNYLGSYLSLGTTTGAISGVVGSTGTAFNFFYQGDSDGRFTGRNYTNQGSALFTTNLASRKNGFVAISRISNVAYIYKNNAQYSLSQTATPPTINSIYLGAQNQIPIDFFLNATFKYQIIMNNSRTLSESNKLESIVTFFNSLQGRQ